MSDDTKRPEDDANADGEQEASTDAASGADNGGSEATGGHDDSGSGVDNAGMAGAGVREGDDDQTEVSAVSEESAAESPPPEDKGPAVVEAAAIATPGSAIAGNETTESADAEIEDEAEGANEKKSELLGVTSNVDAFSAEPEREDEDSGEGDLDELDKMLDDEETPKAGEAFDLESCCSVRRIAVELKHVEQQVREILDVLDTRRKRRLTGTRRWLDLQEDMVNWRYGNKFDTATLDRLQQLVAQRHYMYQRLRFLSGTRPTWNS